MGIFSKVWHRATAVGIPEMEEIESFGADGEEAIYRLLRNQFDCVIRNVIVPHKNLYLEKDFLVIHKGVPVVLEIKNWKGTIGQEGDNFYQDKENGVHKVLKSPVGTTRQFISCMKSLYGIGRDVFGVVVFAEPDCVLKLPSQLDGIFLTTASGMVQVIRECVRNAERAGEEILPERVLHCTRFYSLNREFCKGILSDGELLCRNEAGETVALNTLYLRFITLEHQPLRMRDKMFVTFSNGASGVFYNTDTVLSVQCLDGSFRKIPLSRVRNIVF